MWFDVYLEGVPLSHVKGKLREGVQLDIIQDQRFKSQQPTLFSFPNNTPSATESIEKRALELDDLGDFEHKVAQQEKVSFEYDPSRSFFVVAYRGTGTVVYYMGANERLRKVPPLEIVRHGMVSFANMSPEEVDGVQARLMHMKTLSAPYQYGFKVGNILCSFDPKHPHTRVYSSLDDKVHASIEVGDTKAMRRGIRDEILNAPRLQNTYDTLH